jgi:hypothetical protein
VREELGEGAADSATATGLVEDEVLGSAAAR